MVIILFNPIEVKIFEWINYFSSKEAVCDFEFNSLDSPQFTFSNPLMTLF